MRKILLLSTFLFLTANFVAAKNVQTFAFGDEKVEVDVDTNEVISQINYCDEIQKYGITIITNPTPPRACKKTYEVLQDYKITPETMNGVQIEFLNEPFTCDTFNHGPGLYNGCFYYASRLLQIVVEPQRTNYGFKFLLLHEIARVTGIRPDEDTDAFAYTKVKERAEELGETIPTLEEAIQMEKGQ